MTSASKAQQTADAINVNLTKNYQTKENADNIYATKATLTTTSESLSTSITKAQQTADGAVNAASTAQQTADAININLTKNYQTTKDADDKYATQTSLNATAESIISTVSKTYATKTDVTDAVDGLENTVETTYSTKSEVEQLSDQISSTVTEVSTVKNDLSAAKKVADDAALAASKAQQTANDAKTDAATAQSAADTAKANAAAAQSKADEAANNLAAAEENLNNLQSQADATDEQVAAAKIAVENAKKAADAAQADATIAKNDAATAQSTANTAKANAATAQSTADTAKANAKAAQDDVNVLKNRVTSAETSIKQNSDAITLRATKTEVTEVKSTADTAKSTADAVKTDLESNYSTTTQMNSAIDLKAEGIVSTVSNTYQVKGDYAIKSEVDQTIEGVETKITTVTNTANTLNTLIRQSGNGVEVAKKVNGAYTSTKTLMDSDGFYVKDDSGNNLTQIKPAQAIIGKAESKNVLVNSNGINIRNGENTIASFSEDIVELGKNSKNSVINMCNKNGSIEVVADDGGGYGENFTITGKSGAAIRYQALMEDPNKEGYYIPYEKAQVYVNKRVGNAKVKEAGMSAYDKTYGNARILVSVNEPIYDNNYALIDARNIYLTAAKSVKINGSGILDVYGSLYIKNNKVSDFVVAEGKCDFWTYRMWNSGIAECWGHTSETTVSVTSEWGYMYDSGTGHTNGFPGNTTASSALKFNVTIGGKKYTKLFTSVEHCDCNFISSDNVFIIEIGSGLTNLQTPQVFLLRAMSADVTGKFSYHAIGRWKA